MNPLTQAQKKSHRDSLFYGDGPHNAHIKTLINAFSL
jgi:hypothetical protein